MLISAGSHCAPPPTAQNVLNFIPSSAPVNGDSLTELPYFIFMWFLLISLQKFNKTSKHSMMRTTRLPAVRALVATRCQYQWGMGS